MLWRLQPSPLDLARPIRSKPSRSSCGTSTLPRSKRRMRAGLTGELQREPRTAIANHPSHQTSHATAIHAADKIGALLPASIFHKPQPGDSENEKALPVATPGTPARSRAPCAQEHAGFPAGSGPDQIGDDDRGREPVEMRECNLLKARSELALIWHKSRLTQGDDAGGRP
jgi:hypothetical protein